MMIQQVVDVQSNQVGKPLQVDDQLVLARRKRERDISKEMDRIREEIKYTALHGSALFEANKYTFIEELPEEVGALGKVKKVVCTNNFRLCRLPESIGDLYERLEHLNLSYNNLQEFPLALCRLKYLQRLDMNNNKIKCLPTKVDQLKNLEIWCMDSNFLMAMPHNIATLKKCKHFYIENNPLIKEEDGDQFEPPKDPTIETCSITGEKLGETIYHFVNFVDFAGNKRMPIHFVCASETARDLAVEEKDREVEDFWTLKY